MRSVLVLLVITFVNFIIKVMLIYAFKGVLRICLDFVLL